jgi:hypothetical protein
MKYPHTKSALALGLLVALATGCGAGGYRENQLTRPNVTGNQTTTPTTTVGSTTTTAPAASDINPTVSYDFTITGQGGNFPTWPKTGEEPPALKTDATLKVRVTAGPASQVSPLPGSKVPYSNWTMAYDCVEYTISVLGQTRKTGILKVGTGGTMCPTAPSAKTFDLKGMLYPGHPDIQVKVVGASYSLYCQWLYSGLLSTSLWPYTNVTFQQAQSLYCSTAMYPLLNVHTVTGSIDVEVDGIDSNF